MLRSNKLIIIIIIIIIMIIIVIMIMYCYDVAKRDSFSQSVAFS